MEWSPVKRVCVYREPRGTKPQAAATNRFGFYNIRVRPNKPNRLRRPQGVVRRVGDSISRSCARSFSLISARPNESGGGGGGEWL